MLKYPLVMVRGSRRIPVALVPTVYRARVIACRIDWDPSWKPHIIEAQAIKLEDLIPLKGARHVTP